MPRGEFKHRYWFIADTPNIARTSCIILKRFIMKFWFLLTSQIAGRMYNTNVSIKCMMWKVCRSPTLCHYLQTTIDFKWQKQAPLSCFRPLRNGACTDLSENLSVNCLKGGLVNATTSNPLFFLVDKYPKRISIKKTVTIHLAFPPFLSILKVRQKLVTIKTLMLFLQHSLRQLASKKYMRLVFLAILFLRWWLIYV